MTDHQGQPHPGHHDCFPPMAASITETDFLRLLNEHVSRDPEFRELVFADTGSIGP